MIHKNNLDVPLYSLTVGEYIALQQSLLAEFSKIQQNQGAVTSVVTNNPYISIKDASQEYNIPVNTLYAFNAQMRIPVYRFGKKKFYKRIEIEHFIESSRKSSVSELKIDLPIGIHRKKTKGV